MKHSFYLYRKHVQNLHQKDLQIAVTSAAINFNLGLSDIHHDLEITLGQKFYKIATKRDSLRIAKQNHKQSGHNKKRRKTPLSIK